MTSVTKIVTATKGDAMSLMLPNDDMNSVCDRDLVDLELRNDTMAMLKDLEGHYTKGCFKGFCDDFYKEEGIDLASLTHDTSPDNDKLWDTISWGLFFVIEDLKERGYYHFEYEI